MRNIALVLTALLVVPTLVNSQMNAAQTGVDAAALVQPGAPGDFSPFVDAEGNIARPHGYRQSWVHLGSWFVADDGQAAGAGVHDVYAQPEAVAGFVEHGRWPDGATLVKEVRGIDNARLTTGNAQWAADVGVWFVMVRDRHQRFPQNPLWGEGWGWALFTADSPEVNVSTGWQAGENSCFGCHLPARSTEWVYIDGYPTVRDAAR